MVICLDGTNNHPGAGYTNVQRLFRMLKRDERQIVYYQPGVGTIEPGSVTTSAARRVLMLLDSISALLLRRHVCAAYRFLMAQHQRGDELYFIGFSRGAYAARVLAGMLTKVGLLHAGFEDMVRFAWDAFCARKHRGAAKAFRNAYCRFIPRIRFLGLFDTVSAVGSPWKPRHFERTFRNGQVEIVRHALALDERRAMFVQNLWFDEPASPHRRTDVRQVWFPGGHADVGGGYPEAEAGLSLIPLAWMQRQAAAAGLEFKPRVSAGILDPSHRLQSPDLAAITSANAGMPAHDELHAKLYWQCFEWLPIPRWRPDGHGDWVRHWAAHRGKPRFVPRAALIHESARIRGERVAGYRPQALLVDPEQVKY